MEMRNLEDIGTHVDALAPAAIALGDAVWDTPELCYEERRSCELHTAMLHEQGFTVTPHVAGIPTAVMGESGTAGPVIAFLGEYDALPGLAAQAGICRPVTTSANGHGCGHNLLGAASLLAAAAVARWLRASGMPGRVRYYGCPAEEGGAGKGFMVRAGAFKDVDAAISWHPTAFCGVLPPSSLANMRMDFTFSGRSAHAAASPHLGRSALDAVELMNVGVNYLREHMLPTSRIHYAYVDAGGSAPNVVQSRAVVRYSVRTEALADLSPLTERVKQVAEGAALMTGTTVTSHVTAGVANLLPCPPLEKILHESFMEIGPPRFSEADNVFAREIQATLSSDEIDAAFRQIGRRHRDIALTDFILPSDGIFSLGSTDVGDVSWTVPTVQALGATCAIGTPLHSWQMTAQGKSSIAHTGMIHVARAMALTATQLFLSPELLAQACEDHAARLAEQPYTCPIPPDTHPPVQAGLQD
ncbi:amidohydrolase [Komagataeibacter saccharivorans]|uniref:amidohydrolase n=1 Tax=Komagataeibacter saccharivorans TaxID=265959 RepID=UPI0039E8D4B4